MTEKEINDFEKTQAQLMSLHEEITALSKKSTNDALNKFKLRFVNQTLDEVNRILGDDYRPFADFSKFEDDDLPTNSDVTMMLGQYLNCMEKLRSDNIYKGVNYWYWRLEGKESTIKTSAPQKLKW